MIIMNESSQKPRNIVITGASSGIGQAIALEMAKDEHHFFLIGRNTERLNKVANMVQNLGSSAYIGVGNIRDSETVDKLYVQAMDSLKSIDILIANAGVGHFGYLEDMTISQYDDQFDTNVKGVFMWLRKVLPQMKSRNSGQIIVTSSNLGLNIAGRASLYAATKHAVQAMIGSLREELQGTMVKAATINPGSVDTPWFDGKNVDRSKFLAVEDVAKATRFIIDQQESSNIDYILLSPGIS